MPKLERLRSARRPRRGPPVRVDAQSVPDRRKTPPEAERIPVDAVEFGTSGPMLPLVSGANSRVDLIIGKRAWGLQGRPGHSPRRSLQAGTKRVRQLGHGRARASITRTLRPPDLQGKRARVCPRVDARPLLVFPS